jgi:hypothetical protein
MQCGEFQGEIAVGKETRNKFQGTKKVQSIK